MRRTLLPAAWAPREKSGSVNSPAPASAEVFKNERRSMACSSLSSLFIGACKARIVAEAVELCISLHFGNMNRRPPMFPLAVLLEDSGKGQQDVFASELRDELDSDRQTGVYPRDRQRERKRPGKGAARPLPDQICNRFHRRPGRSTRAPN